VRVLFAAGPMKKTLSAVETCRIAKKVFSSDKLFESMPVSDGGDGFLDAVKHALPDLKEIRINSYSCDMKKIKARVLYSKERAFIESALCAGVLKGKVSILRRSTLGLGVLINELYDNKSRVYVGIGGTLTADIGCGMLKELGFDAEEYDGTSVLKSIRKNKNYSLLYGISDVKSPLNGKNGASLYLKQKGANTAEKVLLEALFDETADNLKISGKKFSGSGGGIGAGIMISGGKVLDNFTFFEELTGIKRKIKESDIIIVNEGNFDRQSFEGKLTGRIVETAVKMKKRVFVISGGFDAEIKGIEKIKVNMPKKRNKTGYIREFMNAVQKTKEFIYG